MIRYIDNTPANVGDTILIDNGERTGRVVAIVQDEMHMREWGVDEPGLMVESDYYGMLFVPADQISDLGCKLVSRPSQP
jgi:hypothetical protein